MRIFEGHSITKATIGQRVRSRRVRDKYTRKGGYDEFQIAMLKYLDDPENNPEFDPEWYTD